MDDDSEPTGQIIRLVPELQRRQRDIGKVPPDHSLLPTALHCLEDRPRDRPSAAQLCQSLGQLKTSETYTASKAEDQQRRLEQQLRLEKEEKDAEIARLQEQMRQLATEKDREVAELRRQLQTTPPQKPSESRKSVTVSTQQVSNKYITECLILLQMISLQGEMWY